MGRCWDDSADSVVPDSGIQEWIQRQQGTTKTRAYVYPPTPAYCWQLAVGEKKGVFYQKPTPFFSPHATLPSASPRSRSGGSGGGGTACVLIAHTPLALVESIIPVGLSITRSITEQSQILLDFKSDVGYNLLSQIKERRVIKWNPNANTSTQTGPPG